MKDKNKLLPFDILKAVEIETITTCNRRCSYCPNSKFDRGLYKNQRIMDENLFKKIINDLSEINFKGRISPHFYNEPLLDKRLPDLMRYARRKLPQAIILIFTNGDFLDIDLFYRLIKYGVKFCITQHSGNMSNKLSLLFKHLGAYPDEVNVVWKSYAGIGGCHIYPNIYYRRVTSGTILLNRGGLVKPQTIERKVECSSLRLNCIVVDYKGNVILCCNDYFSTVIFGDLRKESVAKAWNNPRYKKIRGNLSNDIFELDICKKCVQIR